MQAMRTVALLLIMLLVGCASAAVESPPTPTSAARPTADSPTAAPSSSPTAAPTTAAVATAEPAVAPTATEPSATTVTPSGPVAGRNDNGTFFYGAADAPLTLTDYSDFL